MAGEELVEGRVRPFGMSPDNGKRRGDSWRNARRDTVEDRRRSDKRIADALAAVTLSAAAAGLPALCGLLYQAVAL